MKKLALFSGLLTMFVMPGVLHAAACSASGTVQLQGNQDADDNEFIYTSEAAYKHALERDKEGLKNINLAGKGKVFECDTEQGCADGTYLQTGVGYMHE